MLPSLALYQLPSTCHYLDVGDAALCCCKLCISVCVRFDVDLIGREARQATDGVLRLPGLDVALLDVLWAALKGKRLGRA